MQHMSAFMQQCLVIMLHDAHGQVLVTFNIWDVTFTTSAATGGRVLSEATRTSLLGPASSTWGHCCKELGLRKHESKKQDGIAAMILPKTEALGWLVDLLGEVSIGCLPRLS
jgi:hypothetical protein